jgi:hypothetical protein
MANQTTPHTQTQQNTTRTQDDLEPNQPSQDVGQGEHASLHSNADRAQTGGTRAFNANSGPSNLTNALQETGARSGRTATRTPHGEGQGITNHPVEEDTARQEKVVSRRPDAQAGVDLSGQDVPKDGRG